MAQPNGRASQSPSPLIGADRPHTRPSLTLPAGPNLTPSRPEPSGQDERNSAVQQTAPAPDVTHQGLLYFLVGRSDANSISRGADGQDGNRGCLPTSG